MKSKVLSRTARIFLSSTFRDFGEERDLLVRKVFPGLRSRLKDRFVELVDVDLRWGITAEQAERGEVLPICLAEIDRARPFFVGLLGERYGWIPPADGYPAHVIESQPWLEAHRGGKSVTELEILHGVLNDPKMAGRALFYFRSAGFAEQRGGDYVPASAEDARRQAELKERIRRSGFPVVEDYADPAALAERLEADLWTVLDETFPASEVPDAQAREAMRHEAYAAPRRGLYLGGEAYLKALDEGLASGRQWILIGGQSGAGKSALIANWTEALKKTHEDLVLHVHYLGATADASDPVPLVRRLVEAIRRTVGSDEEVPVDPEKLLESLPLWLANASSWAGLKDKRFVIVIDALNGLTDRRDLRWFPSFLPERVQLVVSSLPGEVKDHLREKVEWTEVAVRPLDRGKAEALFVAYLRQFNKELPPDFVSRIMEHALVANPLFLRTLAEELRLFGVHERLGERLEHYLTSRTVDDLFERVLERVEEDNGADAVSKVMVGLWASRAGLTEEEIRAWVGLKPAEWAYIRNALGNALLEGSGRIVFGHGYFVGAVVQRYGLRGHQAISVHNFLLDFLKSRRSVDEQSLDIRYHERQIATWESISRSLIKLEMRKDDLSSEKFSKWDGHWLALHNRLTALQNMVSRDARCHQSEVNFLRAGGADTDYTTYWKFPCCDVTCASEYGKPTRFREDGCAHANTEHRDFRTVRLDKNNMLTFWDGNDLRTAIEVELRPLASKKEALTTAENLGVVRLLTPAVEQLEGMEIRGLVDWSIYQTIRDYWNFRSDLELACGDPELSSQCRSRSNVYDERMKSALGTNC